MSVSINMNTVKEFVGVSARIGKFIPHCIHIDQFWPLKPCQNLVEPIFLFEIFKLIRLEAIFRSIINNLKICEARAGPGSNPG